MKIRSFFLFLTLFCPFFFTAQNLNPVKWEVSYSEISNTEGTITVIATIEKKWHIYSQRPTSDGPIPTSFVFSPAKDFQLSGKTEEIGAKEEYVKAFEAKLFTFEEKAVFKQKIKRSNPKAFTTPVKLEYMTCNDMQCLPPKTVDLTLSVPAALKK